MGKIDVSLRRIVPALSRSRYKGQDGRIGVLGGSLEYTGAPYYAGISTLKAGGDLAWILCNENAAIPIKSYSPELIVIPSISEMLKASPQFPDSVKSMLERLHVLVIGPGLGRDESTLQVVGKIIEFATSIKLPMVIDGDGLFLVAQKPSLVKGNVNIILTPNRVEFQRLYRAVFNVDPQQKDIPFTGTNHDSNFVIGNEESEACKLSAQLGNVTILQKGHSDVISNAHHHIIVTRPGSLRRCGGQGDVLAGLCGLFTHWSSQSLNSESETMVMAAVAASSLTRTAARLAFEKTHRATTTPDIINMIGAAFPLVFDE